MTETEPMAPHYHEKPHEKSALEHRSFLLLLAIVSLMFVWIAWPFSGPILWAALAAIMFQPLYRWVLRHVRGRRNLAASLVLLLIFIAVLLPALWIGSMVLDEAIALVNTLRANPIDIAELVDTVFAQLPASAKVFVAERGWNDVSFLQARLEEVLEASAGIVAQEAVAIGSGALGFFLSFGLGLYVLFFFLRDGKRIGEAVLHAAPIERAIADRLAERFLGIVRAVIKGSGVVGLVQGSVGALALLIVGVPSVLLLGVLMAILALIPAVGTALVWGPVGIWLLIAGDVWEGIFVLGSGAIIISSVDNVLRPILVGRDTGIPDWLILITTLGGISLAGVSGIVLGPIVAGLFLASWSILGEQRAGDAETADRFRTRVGVDGKARPRKDDPEDQRPVPSAPDHDAPDHDAPDHDARDRAERDPEKVA
jgi:predicted PurR-regulated permease PerM